MKKEKDRRVNKNYVSMSEYTFLFIVLAAFNGFHMWIYQVLYRRGVIESNTQLAINILMLFVIITAAIIIAIIGFYRDKYLIRPIRKLSEAAREIAKGNFSVRIAPRRKDKKKDFVDIMFEDFNTMTEELASIETMKNDFIANVSHEIKTPLSIIQTYTTALQSDVMQTDKRMEYTHTILEATHKLSALVTNILKLSKLENQEIIGEAKPFDLSEQLRRITLMFADKMEQKNIHFEEDFDEISACYDENLLEIVWNNLLSNAIKFTNPGGAIFFSLKVIDNKIIQVSVKDTGCGIDEVTQKHIFDKFFQGDTSHTGEGNGLGLALAKKTIDLLGGTITVNSTPNLGSTFTVCLSYNKTE